MKVCTSSFVATTLGLLLVTRKIHGWTLGPRNHMLVAPPGSHRRLTQLFASENKENENDPDMPSTTPTSNPVEAATTTAAVAEQQQEENQPRPSPVSPPRSLTTRDMMTAMGTSPRRIFLSGLSATGIALAGNLFGVTSQLLTTFPEDQVAATGLDTYFPRGDYKRVRTADYQLVIPKEWVADTTLELEKAKQRSMSLDYSMRGSAPKATSVLPDAAFGPPGNLLGVTDTSAGDTNVSIFRTPAPSNFRLRQVMATQSSDDNPTTGAQFLLQNFLAGKGRQVTLLSADADSSNADSDKTIAYRFSYRVDRGETRVPLQAVSVIAQKFGTTASGGSTLFTFTVVAPAEAWQSDFSTKLTKMANSFQVTPN